MRQRCQRPNHADYPNYGARGIYVCDEWNDFATFQKWCLATYVPGKSIDRVDNDGPYAPWNCRWATQSEQTLNSRMSLAGIHSLQAKRLKEYGDPRTRKEKRCSKCHRWKRTDLFTKDPSHKLDGLSHRCKSCNRKIAMLYRSKKGKKPNVSAPLQRL